MAAAGQQWVTFDDDDDEALSFSDLPVSAEPEEKMEEPRGSPMKDDFEFRILGGGSFSSEPDMCAAEDIFFHGKLLPLRASFSSECSLLTRGQTRPVSRSDSATSLGLGSWRSTSSSASSGCVSRSLSSNSCASNSDAQPPPLSRSISNAFPSPSPRVRPVRKNRRDAGRRSTGSTPPVGWGLLRLGVAKAPEIELHDIRLRQAGGAGAAGGSKSSGGGSVNNNEKRSSVNGVSRLLGGFGCSCSPEDSISAASVLIVKKKGSKVVAGFSGRRERMFEWLEELSLGKG